MKRTLITLLALAGVAMGGSVTYTSDDFTNGAITLDANFFKSGETAKYDYILDLNVDAIVSTLVGTATEPVTLNTGEGVSFAELRSNGTVQTISLGNYGTHGLCLQASTSSNFTGAGSSSEMKGYSFVGVSDATGGLSINEGSTWYNYSNPNWWSDITAATLTISDPGLSTYYAVLSVTKNGVVYDVVASQANRDIGTFGATSTIQINTNFVNSVTLIPEPATATLSLLALAGLAARRRRR